MQEVKSYPRIMRYSFRINDSLIQTEDQQPATTFVPLLARNYPVNNPANYHPSPTTFPQETNSFPRRPDEDDFYRYHGTFMNPLLPEELMTATKTENENNNSSGSLIKTEEIVILTIIFSLWIGIIILFFKQWGKIRHLEPYHSPFEAAEEDPTMLVSVPGTTSPLARLNSTKLLRTSTPMAPNYSNLITKNKWKKVNTLVHVMAPPTSITTASVPDTTDSKSMKKKGTNEQSEAHLIGSQTNLESSVMINKSIETGLLEVREVERELKKRSERRKAWKELSNRRGGRKEVKVDMNMSGLNKQFISCLPLETQDDIHKTDTSGENEIRDRNIDVETTDGVDKPTDSCEGKINQKEEINPSEINGPNEIDPGMNQCHIDMEPILNVFHIQYTVNKKKNDVEKSREDYCDKGTIGETNVKDHTCQETLANDTSNNVPEQNEKQRMSIV